MPFTPIATQMSRAFSSTPAWTSTPWTIGDETRSSPCYYFQDTSGGNSPSAEDISKVTGFVQRSWNQ